MRLAPKSVLNNEERSELRRLVRSGITSARVAQPARILLSAAVGPQRGRATQQTDVPVARQWPLRSLPALDQNPEPVH
jgi:hypothetical protein